VIGQRPQEIYRSGVARTFQRSRLSLPLTVFDNIVIGDYQHMQHGLFFNVFKRRAFRAEYDAYVAKIEALLQIFSPPLVDRLFEPVETFSMIDRRRIEVCRALLSQPRLLLLDEPSLGLAPRLVAQIMAVLLRMRDERGLTVLLVEQNARSALSIADRAIVLNLGTIAIDKDARLLAGDDQLRHAYLGF
jgi:branched-chain amino acid transport system ATP-binding protein/sulfate-transporting ATPase